MITRKMYIEYERYGKTWIVTDYKLFGLILIYRNKEQTK